MSMTVGRRLLIGTISAIAVLGLAAPAVAQQKIKIGVIYDLTGPLAGGGSELQYTGAKIMLDSYAKKEVEGYKIEAVYADAQSKPDVAINEAIRLIEQEKVDMLLGFFSSALASNSSRNSCGLPPVFPRLCSTTRISSTSSVRRRVAINSA